MHKTYYELTVTVDEAFTDLIADYIINLTDEAIEVEASKIIIRSENDLHSVKDALEEFAQSLGDDSVMQFSLEEKENQDWIKNYKNSIQPIEAGKFYIFPSWYEPKEGLINIKIDPALAFGSGHHATTFSCLGAISKYVNADDHVINVGCGSGILGLACKKLGATVELCDTDPISVQSTQENFALNDESYDKLWEGSANKTKDTYNVVIANIIADVLKFIAKDLKAATKENGYLILSGILDKKEQSVLPSFKELTLCERILKDEWVTLVYKKEING